MSPEATTQAPPAPGAPAAEAQSTPPGGAAAVPGASPGAPEAGGPGEGEARGVEFPDLSGVSAAEAVRGDPERNIELIRDVVLKVKVELGRGKMCLRDVLRLTEGSVVELEKLAGDPLDIYVNDRLVGKGEVLVLNENFCVRITQIFSPEECLRIKGIS